nr:hypothetical protein [Tanacetum cinerariifolium]
LDPCDIGVVQWEKRVVPAEIGARAHGEVGEGVLVLFRCLQVYRKRCRGRGCFWRESWLGGTVWVIGVWGYGKFGPWCLESLQLDLELVPELWTLDKLSFNVILFDEKLLLDPALSYGFCSCVDIVDFCKFKHNPFLHEH